MKKIFVFIFAVILIVIIFIKSGSSAPFSTQHQIQTDKIPAKYQADKQAFVDSIIATNKARDLTQPKNGIIGSASEEGDKEILSNVDKAISLSGKVSDGFLDTLHPELKNMYRNKLITGAKIWEEGIKTKNLQKQIEGAKLDEEWLDWFNEHKDDVGNKVF